MVTGNRGLTRVPSDRDVVDRDQFDLSTALGNRWHIASRSDHCSSDKERTHSADWLSMRFGHVRRLMRPGAVSSFIRTLSKI